MSIKTRTSGIMVNINVEPAASGFQGAGDIVSGAYAWWGTRAYNAASIGTSAIILKYNDTTEITYATIAGGGLPVTTIDADTITHGAPVTVSQLFDQTGNGRHLVQVARPSFSLTGNGLSVPSIGFVAASVHRMTNGAFGTNAQPLTYGVVANHTASGANQNLLVTVNGANYITSASYRQTANNTVAAYAGTLGPDATVNDGTWAAVQVTFTNTTADVLAVNSSQNTGTAFGAATLDTTCNLADTTTFFDGFFTEAGIWPIAFSGAQLTSMYQNQKAYYGLP